MARRRMPPPFLLVIIDEDAKTFSVEGPMIDDRSWNDAIWNARQAGRMVRCFSTQSDEAAAIRWGQEKGLTPCDHILSPVLD